MLTVDRTPVRLDVEIRAEGEFDFLSSEYRDLYASSAATAFQAPLWMHMVHSRLAPGLNARQHTLVVRDRSDRSLLAVLPFVLQKSMGMEILQPADFGVCDYNSVVADDKTLATMAADADLLSRLDDFTKGCDLLLFRKVREDGFDVGRLFPKARNTPAENEAYLSELGDDFEEWRRQTIRKKFSKELGRLQRQVDRDFGGYQHRAATSEADIRAAFDFLKIWRQGRFEEDLLDKPLYFDFYRDYAIAAAATGEAITYVSYVAGKPVALLFGVAGDGEFHAVLIGSDTENFGKFSVGTQIIYQVIKQRFDVGFRRFDMGLGNTGYKSHFRVEATALRNYTRTRSVPGSVMAMVYHHAKPMKNFLRKYAPNVR